MNGNEKKLLEFIFNRFTEDFADYSQCCNYYGCSSGEDLRDMANNLYEKITSIGKNKY